VALGNASARSDALPNATAVAETVPGYDCPAWIGVFAPHKTPRETLGRINGAITSDASNDATYKGYAKTLGLQPPPAFATTQALESVVKDEAARSKAVIQ
jgi:tripartite-type tricarboxylate transporter receptor subunit TctC